ncbi:hypothetical protein [Rhodopila sp.]
MTHFGYIAAAYAIAIGVVVFFLLEVAFRVRSDRRRLEAIGASRDRSYQ